jgi:Transglutaminase-like superfamily
VPGSSDPIDGAAGTLLADAGVCRDYAHLVIALLRAVNVSARLVSVYAPGCDPMDFHPVVEACVEGQWRVVDATCLAPRQSMVRIATGRHAADTAFLDNHKGAITLRSMKVTAIVDGVLPHDGMGTSFLWADDRGRPGRFRSDLRSRARQQKLAAIPTHTSRPSGDGSCGHCLSSAGVGSSAPVPAGHTTSA